MNDKYRSINAALTEWGLRPCTDSGLSRCERFTELFTEANKKMNLTSVTAEDEIITRHYIDSLAIYRSVRPAGRVMDLGCGGGLPGIPVKIYDEAGESAIETLTMLDSTAKKLTFVREAAEEIGLSNVETVAGRAEELIIEEPSRRESYDIVMSRAVARLNVLCELALPYLKIGGAFAAMKTEKATDEVQEAARGIALLGAETESIDKYCVDGRNFIVLLIRKTSHTSARYPRKYAQILKKPL